LIIVSFLSPSGLCSGAAVSKQFKNLTEDNSIWGTKLLERFGHLFEEEEGTERTNDEDFIAKWPAAKPFKNIFKELSLMETQKDAKWAVWGSVKENRDQIAGSKITGTCPMCQGVLFIEKNVVPKKEDDEDVPPSEFVVQCKTLYCGFVLPYSSCVACKRACNMINTFVCVGEECERKPMAQRINCWDCAKECGGKETDRCLGSMCGNCIKKVGSSFSCPNCCFHCNYCSLDYFAEQEKIVCRKCKKFSCNHCHAKNCPACGYKSDQEDEDEEFGEHSEEDEDDYEEDASD